MARRRRSRQLGLLGVRPVFWWALGGVALLAIILKRRTIVSAAQSGLQQLLTLDALRKAVPGASVLQATNYIGPLTDAMAEAQIDTPLRAAAFLAQLGHESGSFKFFEELASGEAYENRCGTKKQQIEKYGRYYGGDLGNCQPGDGRRFKGRGPIQITGRGNYRAFGKAVGMDFESQPELLASPEWGFKAAAWFWNSRNLNKFADVGDFDAVTYRINGGYNGKADRDRRYALALEALGVTPGGQRELTA